MKRLFDAGPPKQRSKPRVLMHVIDASCDAPDETTDIVRMGCRKCGKTTDWQLMKRSEAKRGVPCPQCNQEPTQ